MVITERLSRQQRKQVIVNFLLGVGAPVPVSVIRHAMGLRSSVYVRQLLNELVEEGSVVRLRYDFVVGPGYVYAHPRNADRPPYGVPENPLHMQPLWE